MHESTHQVQWESELADLLNDLSSVQDELLDVLMRKRDRMAANDVAGMTALQPAEEQLQERLATCQARRTALLERAAGEGKRADDLDSLAARLPDPPGSDVRRQVRAVSSRMRLLQHHSLTNWVVAQRSLLHLSQLLEIIATGGRLQPTYGSGDDSCSRGSLVDQEV